MICAGSFNVWIDHKLPMALAVLNAAKILSPESLSRELSGVKRLSALWSSVAAGRIWKISLSCGFDDTKLPQRNIEVGDPLQRGNWGGRYSANCCRPALIIKSAEQPLM